MSVFQIKIHAVICESEHLPSHLIIQKKKSDNNPINSSSEVMLRSVHSLL